MKTTKRFSKIAAILAVLALVAAACGGDEPAEFGDLGGVVVEDGEDIQIRSVNAITGDVAFLGIPNQRAVELAIENYGPIKGHNVTIGTGLDDLCSNEGGQAAGQTVASDEQVVGVIGTSCSSAAVAMSPLVSEAGMVMISPSNTSPALTSNLAGTASEDNHAGYYRTAHNDLSQGAAVADFIFNELGLATVATIHDGSSYSEGLVNAMNEAFRELGGETTVATAINVGDTDMVPVLTEIAATTPAAIFAPVFMPEGGFLVQQISGVAGLENTTMVQADATLTDNFLELPESAGVYVSGPNLNYEGQASSLGTTADEFLTQYEDAYGEAPSAAFWAHSYDATVMLLTAIEAVSEGGDGSALTIDRQALRDELYATSGLAGLTGTVTCDEFGDCGGARIAVYQNDDPSNFAATYENFVFTWEP